MLVCGYLKNLLSDHFTFSYKYIDRESSIQAQACYSNSITMTKLWFHFVNSQRRGLNIATSVRVNEEQDFDDIMEAVYQRLKTIRALGSQAIPICLSFWKVTGF